MAELPVLPVTTDAFLADTSHMSAEAVGAYTRILFVMWRHGGRLADDDRELARIAGLSLFRWRQVADVVRRCLTVAGGQVSQKRLTATWLSVRERRRVAAENGERGAAVRWGDRGPGGNEPGSRSSNGNRDSDDEFLSGCRSASACDSSPDLWQTPFSGDGKSMGIQIKKERGLVESQSGPGRPEPLGKAVREKKPPAGSLATARGVRALARPPGAESGANGRGGKPPHQATRSELEEAFAARRAGIRQPP